RPGRIVDVDGRCLLPEAPLGRCWDNLRRAWGPGARKLPGGPRLRLTLRLVVGGVVLAVEPEGAERSRARSGSAPLDPGSPEELVEEVRELTAIWWTPAGGEPELLAGDPAGREAWRGREVCTRARAFLQVNRAGATILHQAVLPALGNPHGRRYLDAYCGVGTWGRDIARAGGTAVGIERDPAAVAAAREDAPGGFTVLEGSVEERLEEALPADVAVLNPPRSGLEASVPARLRTSGVERLVYVSCDPATLARDLGRLGGAYRITALEAFDLFPQTAHVEVLAVLDRSPESSSCATT
ncbi:MAG TPA: hypothetical protein VE173_09740, partial [Longimicrobiales bacterium]|nr:hypothetical protein [Longimicrobiales bacterium]